MKVFAIPTEVPAPTPDYRNYDRVAESAKEKAHVEALKAHLVEMGYNGPNNGDIVRYGVADGYAQYMLADGKGRYGSSFLFHLPYGDAYSYNGIQHFPKKAILEEINRGKRLAKLFGER